MYSRNFEFIVNEILDLDSHQRIVRNEDSS